SSATSPRATGPRALTGPSPAVILQPAVFRRPRFDYQLKRPPVSRERLRSMPRYADAVPVESAPSEVLSPHDFRERYVKTRTPVVIRGGVRHWKAWSDWDADYLRTVAGAESIQVT